MTYRLPTRLGKFLRERTGVSLARLEEYFRGGRIELSFDAPLGLRELVFEGDTVTFDGKSLTDPSPPLYFMLHKPCGVTTTVHSPDNTADLSPWLAQLEAGVFPVGRLDRDSSGLLLLTNDGDLSFALLSPSHHVEKQYHVTVTPHERLSPSLTTRLKGPLSVDGESLSALRVEVLSDTTSLSQLSMVIEEGKHRQIRKMCRAVGLRVRELQRTRIGGVTLENLPVGEMRPLHPFEVKGLWESAGGRQTVRKRQLEALLALARATRLTGTAQPRLEQWLKGIGFYP